MRFKLGEPVLAIMMVSTLLLASCSTAPSSPDKPSTGPAVAKSSGSLNLGWNAPLGTDLRGGIGNVWRGLGSAVYEGMARLDADGKQVPSLAERWEISSDGLTHTFYIRKGVKFHDGSDMTGEDVRFTFERAMALDNPDPDSARWRSIIASLELKDGYTLVLNMKQPSFELIYGIEGNLSPLGAVISKKYVTENGPDYLISHPMGTGPWKATKWQPGGISLDLEAFEGHWRPAPPFNNISILFVLEDATRVAMLKTGELDMAIVPPDSAADLKAAGLKVLPFDGGSQVFGFWYWDRDNPSKYPLGDVRVRKALHLGVDRSELAKIYAGYAAPIKVFYLSQTVDFWDSTVFKPDPYDQEQAKKLLAEAGYANGFRTTMYESGTASLAAQAVVNAWGKLGVQAEIVATDYTTAGQALRGSNGWNKVHVLRTGGTLWGFALWVSMHQTTDARSYTNPKVDDLIRQSALTTDPAQKKRLRLEAVTTARNEYPYLALLDLKTIFAIGAKIGEVKLIPDMGMQWGPIYETITHAK